ncbi:LRR receptor-like serine/threonine-protein kinase RPK2 [Amaranthus tricolor]|uniref:LRR receptor-like serine/threonine-protein kinase RPK2 n=1 Tax=Amaranthus tricolor TaxID=29722 RepID=UPI002591199E|nr:LRR receptor-like serine/threonine-protein kinase RPK2 [Amaranthus tricolor]XP_057530837.1 LRR receptor-like serine/threonine-protein kinase RPK2 [Amaranthus tricolor]XP_057530838.1 LRR receptor-like serine/threonine-protein kinase RPK2 [Amaranthus tricolor]
MQIQAFLFLSLSYIFFSFATSDDASALLSFKSSISHDPSKFLSNWSPSTNYCNWRGISCANARVVSLNLTFPDTNASSFLAGTLHSSVGNLSELRVLSIPHHAFSGEIPAEIGMLRNLEVIELQGNNFSGKTPNEMCNLSSSLRLLNFSSNFLTGKIPSRLIGSGKIRVVDLSDNQLSGKINVAHNCMFLTHLKLSNNFLVGNIPAEIGSCLNLRTLLLDGNILEGNIPPKIGQLSELRVLDVSRNSLTDRIPRELANCRKLAVLVLTNLVEFSDDRTLDIFRGEYNAFMGGVPEEVLQIPSLLIFWAPRANIGGRLPGNWSESCSLRILNLGQNYIDGIIPEGIAMCRNLTFLDLSSNGLFGNFPFQFPVSCMVYLNVSWNSLSGFLQPSINHNCGSDMDLKTDAFSFLEVDIQNFYPKVKLWDLQLYKNEGPGLGDSLLIKHDFGWNNFTGSLPLFSVSDGLMSNSNVSYELSLNDNDFNGSLTGKLLTGCQNLHSVSVNLTANQISGQLYPTLLQDCLKLTSFEAAQNRIWGSISSGISNCLMLSNIDLRENQLSGSLPNQLGDLRTLKTLLLGGNNFTGKIPPHLGQLNSVEVLDLSNNNLKGPIPSALENASNLKTLLLDHNMLTGEIPLSFSSLSHLVKLDVSFNNLSGHIPHLQNISDCESFKGNRFLHSCPDPYSAPPTDLPVPLEVEKMRSRSKMKSLIIATVASVSVVVGALLVVVLGLTLGKKKLGKLTCLRRKVVVTFVETPVELTYDNVVNATGNFSIRKLIGTGGFGSTYKAELVPGYLVAVKRLSIGRFQGIQQFEAEIKTLGRVRHKNLVTLIGYYVGDTEMFLIYNYLSGGNLETLIRDRSAMNVKWPEIYKITADVAHALAYLHYSCVPRIVHRDIKPSNILLDEDLNAYLSDFGLARLLEVSQTHATTDVAGTFGYVAPEYATTCRVSDKADVYSFGVVLLELMSGKKTLDPSFSEYGNGFNIVGWAMLLMDEGRCSEFFYAELWEEGPEENLLKMLQLALSCTVESLAIRPSMKQVLEKLKQLSS